MGLKLNQTPRASFKVNQLMSKINDEMKSSRETSEIPLESKTSTFSNSSKNVTDKMKKSRVLKGIQEFSIDLMKDTKSNNRPIVQFEKAELKLDMNYIIETSPIKKSGLITLESLHNEKINRKIGYERKECVDREMKYDDDFFDFSLKPTPIRKNSVNVNPKGSLKFSNNI